MLPEMGPKRVELGGIGWKWAVFGSSVRLFDKELVVTIYKAGR